MGQEKLYVKLSVYEYVLRTKLTVINPIFPSKLQILIIMFYELKGMPLDCKNPFLLNYRAEKTKDNTRKRCRGEANVRYL